MIENLEFINIETAEVVDHRSIFKKRTEVNNIILLTKSLREVLEIIIYHSGDYRSERTGLDRK